MGLRKMLIGTFIFALLLNLCPLQILQHAEASGETSVVGTTTTPLSISYPFQLKAFQASSRVWVFYSDGKNLVVSSSPDGVLWSAPTLVRPDCTLGEQFSVGIDGKRVHYAYAGGRAGASLYYRSGLLNEDGTIAWSTPEQVIVPGKGKGILSTPCISVDGHGYPWIGYRKVEDQSNKRPMVTKSSKADGTWSTAHGFPYDLAGWTAAAWVAVPIPLSDGKVLALFTSSGHYVRSKIWKKGIWSNRVLNPNPGIGVSSPHLSVVAQGDDVHLVFLSSTSLIYTKYAYAADRWSPEVRPHGPQVTPTSSPVLSLGTGGDLYLFWAGSPKENRIYFKKQAAGVWDPSPMELIDESAEKLTGNGFLFAPYQANSEKHIGYLTGKAAPYRVKFFGGPPPLSPLKVKITSPKDGEVFNATPISVTGELTHSARVWVNGTEVPVANNKFSVSVPLTEGDNPITVEAKDEFGQRDLQNIRVTLLTKGKISGTITDSATGFPLASALVEVTDALHLLHQGSADGEGKYLMANIASGPFVGKVTKNGYTPYPLSGTLAPSQILPLNAALSPILPKIDNVKVSDVTTDSARITWETDQPADARVDYGETASYGDMKYDPALKTAHAFLLSNLKAGTTYYFKVTSRNGYGFGSTSDGHSFVTQQVSSPLRLNITYPQDGSILYNAWTRVEGEVVNTLGQENGVVVNGVLAQVYGNRFFCNRVPLVEGANTITAKATDSQGNTAEAFQTINVNPSTGYLRISASTELGFSPLELLFVLESDMDLANADLGVVGPGPVEWLEKAKGEYRLKINEEGIYLFTASLMDSKGKRYEDSLVISLVPKAEIEERIRARWDGMVAAIAGGDIEGGISYFAPGAQEEYRKVFLGLGAEKVRTLLENIQELRLGRLNGRYGSCEAIRQEAGGLYSYPVTFVQGADGLWKIKGF